MGFKPKNSTGLQPFDKTNTPLLIKMVFSEVSRQFSTRTRKTVSLFSSFWLIYLSFFFPTHPPIREFRAANSIIKQHR